MSTVGQYLDDLTEDGTRDSSGQFSVNSERGARLFGGFALPSAHHCLLKVVQVAHLLCGDEIRVTVGLNTTEIQFALPSDSLETARTALLFEPGRASGGRDTVADLMAMSLLGAMAAQKNVSAAWSLVDAGGETSVVLDREYQTHRNSRRVAPGEACCRFALRHGSTWRMWETWTRRSAVDALLSGLCAYSAIPLFLNGRPVPHYGCAALNEELREIFGSSFDAGTGVNTVGKARVAASLVLFDADKDGKSSVSLALPDQDYYSEQQPGRFVWKRYDESEARPDGADVPTYSLGFRDGGAWGAWPESRQRFRRVLGFNLHGPGSMDPLRLKVVRHGVLISDEVVATEDPRLKGLRGCSALICDDSTLTTDLSGFRLVEDEAYLERALSLLDLAELGHTTFEELTPELAGL